MNEEAVKKIITDVIGQYLSQKGVQVQQPAGQLTAKGFEIPVEASARHVHLSPADIERLFGPGHKLTPKKPISQPGQYLSEERVTLIGPKGEFRNVAVLGPPRKQTQVEISLTDARTLGVNAPVAMSGDLSQAADIIMVSDKNVIRAEKCVIAARNHVHMAPQDALAAGLKDGDLVDIRIDSARPITFNNVVVRAGDTHKLAFHIDTDEVNACQFTNGARGYITGLTGGGSVCPNAPSGAPSQAPACPASPGEAYGPNDVMIGTKFLSEKQVKAVVDNGCSSIILKPGTILSPLAKDYANRYKVKIKYL